MKNIKFLFFALILISQGIAQSGAWYPESSAINTFARGCAITWGGNDTLYALRGTNTGKFYAYVISSNWWIQYPNIESVPQRVDSGGAIVRVRQCSLYVTRGKNSGDFYLYNIRNNTWLQKASLPSNDVFLPGAALCWAGGDTIYAFKGGQYQTFYKYIISQNQWIILPNTLPRIAYKGAGMCWAGENSKFYAIFGGSNNDFFLYDPQFNPPWTSCASSDISWNDGASLVWNGETKIYAVTGGNTKTAQVYDISNNPWISLPDAPENIGGSKEGAGLLAWDNRVSQKQLYLICGSADKSFYRYCLPLSFPLNEKETLMETFKKRQFPPPGWQAKLEQGSATVRADNWQRLTTGFTLPDPHPDTVVVGHAPTGDTRKRARLITPKLYLGVRPSLIKIQFYMWHSDAGNNNDTLEVGYYKGVNLFNVASFYRNTSGYSGWTRKEIMFVEQDTILISFHAINKEGDDDILVDSLLISIDTTQLYSNTYQATASNGSHLLARKPETDRLHTIFRYAILDASGNPDGRALLYYSYSDDHGTSWSPITLIDTGYVRTEVRAATSIATGVFDSKEPWIIYTKTVPGDPDYNPYRIMAAIQRQNGTWKKMQLYYTGDRILEISMAMGLTQGAGAPERVPDLAYVVAVTQLSSKVVFFAFDTTGIISNTFTELVPHQEYSYRNPSIAITPGDYIHIAYQHLPYGFPNRIYYITDTIPTNNYSTRQYGVANWSPTFRVSYHQDMSYIEPASYPSVEAYGNSVFVAWRGKNASGGDIGEIWRRKRNLSNHYDNWYDPQNMSQSPSQESHYPVMSSSQVTAFQEDISSRNKEVYANFWDNYIQDISETDSLSYFPHINAEATELQRPPYALPVNTIWTEQLSNYVYQIMSERYIYPVEGKLEYYTIETGDSVQSPYCLQRDGYISYPELPIDFGNQKAAYQIPYLHPNYHHKIKAVVYQRAGNRFRQNFTIDSIPIGSIEYDPNIAETIEIEIPKETYQVDSKAVLEITKNRGQFVTLAKPLIVYQYEVPETTTSSGPQSAGRITILTKPRLYQNYPNPFKTQTTIRYSLPIESKVSLLIYDISGRSVKTLVNQHQPSGVYSIKWDGRDNRGKSISSGVYFYRLKTDNFQTTNRAIIIR